MGVKIKPLTSELIEEISEKSGVDIKDVRTMFHIYWRDLGNAFTHACGYSIMMENFGTFYMNMKTLAYIKDRENRIRLGVLRIGSINKSEWVKPQAKAAALQFTTNTILTNLSNLLTLQCALNAYEQKVRKQYPKKYKANLEAVQAALERIQKYFNVPISSIPITVHHPIQEIYVRKLSKSGLLQNPVYKESKKMQSLRMRNISKNGLPGMQLSEGVVGIGS